MQRRAFVTLFFTIFLDMLGIGILIPVIPILLADPASPHYLLSADTSREVGYYLLGILTAIFSIGQFFAAPIIGELSDKFGRKPLLMTSISAIALCHALFAVAIGMKSVPLLFITRFLAGVSSGNIVVAQASIADITQPKDRAKNFGLIGAAFGLGFIIGPFIGGKLADPTVVSWFSASTPFWFASALSVLNFIFVTTMLRETNHHRDRERKISWGKSVKNIFHAMRLPKLKPLFMTGFLMQSGFSFYVTFASVFLISRFGFTEGDIGNYFAYVGIWVVFTQGVMTRFLARRFSEEQVLRWSIFVMGLSILAILLSEHVTLLYAIVPFYALSIGISQSNLTGLISKNADQHIQGEVLGINGSVNALATTLPPLLSGLIAGATRAEAPLLIAAIVVLFGGAYFVNHLRGKSASAVG